MVPWPAEATRGWQTRSPQQTILLTASAAMLGAVPIIIDPIFSGLAWSLIFGLFASTLFTLFVIPVVYWLLYANKPSHGLPQSTMEG